jgi:hypothetical protein
MNDDRSLERAARSWLEAGPTQAPDRPVKAALFEIESTSQERDLQIPWRLPTMYPLTRLGAMVAIAAVGLVGALLLLRPGVNSGIGAASPSPTAGAPTPSASALPTSAQTVVDAADFAAPFRMTWNVPIGQQVKADVVDIFPGRGALHVFHVERVGRDPCRSNDLLPTALTTPQALMDWLGTIPKTTSGPVTTTSIGGHDALERVLSVGSLDGCMDTSYLHSGIVSQYGDGPGGYFITAGDEERWIALEVNGLLIAISVGPNDDPVVASAAARALGTLEFKP